jgi:apolipoprotein D and lipocalin family protein
MNRRARALAVLISAAVALAACASLQRGPVGNAAVPEPTRPVDLSRYAGLWYEIGRYENGFQRDCEATTATYTVREDGLVGVLNACREGGLEGDLKTVEGRARVVEGSGNARLKVSFFGPFYFGDYWIMDHADDYSWSIVGEGSGRYLWLLSRTPRPTDQVREEIMSRARDLGYDLSLVRPTRQPPS